MGLIENAEPIERLFTQGMVIKNGAKMSKSKGNVVSPDDMIARYGADSTRMYSLFAAPPDRDLDWQESGVEGVSRFLSRVYRFVLKHAGRARGASSKSTPVSSGVARQLDRKLHQTIRKITSDFDGRWHFNTSIAAIMELVNALYAADEQITKGTIPAHQVAGSLRTVALLIAPFAPYLAAELWETLGYKSVLLRESWPEFDPELAREDEVEIPVQINGKNRSHIVIAVGTPDEKVRELALADEKIKAAIAGKQIVRVIIVPNKLMNIVVK